MQATSVKWTAQKALIDFSMCRRQETLGIQGRQRRQGTLGIPGRQRRQGRIEETLETEENTKHNIHMLHLLT